MSLENFSILDGLSISAFSLLKKVNTITTLSRSNTMNSQPEWLNQTRRAPAFTPRPGGTGTGTGTTMTPSATLTKTPPSPIKSRPPSPTTVGGGVVKSVAFASVPVDPSITESLDGASIQETPEVVPDTKSVEVDIKVMFPPPRCSCWFMLVVLMRSDYFLYAGRQRLHDFHVVSYGAEPPRGRQLFSGCLIIGDTR